MYKSSFSPSKLKVFQFKQLSRYSTCVCSPSGNHQELAAGAQLCRLYLPCEGRHRTVNWQNGVGETGIFLLKMLVRQCIRFVVLQAMALHEGELESAEKQ